MIISGKEPTFEAYKNSLHTEICALKELVKMQNQKLVTHIKDEICFHRLTQHIHKIEKQSFVYYDSVMDKYFVDCDKCLCLICQSPLLPSEISTLKIEGYHFTDGECTIPLLCKQHYCSCLPQTTPWNWVTRCDVCSENIVCKACKNERSGLIICRSCARTIDTYEALK